MWGYKFSAFNVKTTMAAAAEFISLPVGIAAIAQRVR